LSSFAILVSGQDADLLFQDGSDAVQPFIAYHAPADEPALRRDLSAEAHAFDRMFGANPDVRQKAWWALGANAAAPDLIDLLIKGAQQAGDRQPE